METEKAFLEVLGRVGGRIAGQQLEFLDAAGNVVARFEARAGKSASTCRAVITAVRGASRPPLLV